MDSVCQLNGTFCIITTDDNMQAEHCTEPKSLNDRDDSNAVCQIWPFM